MRRQRFKIKYRGSAIFSATNRKITGRRRKTGFGQFRRAAGILPCLRAKCGKAGSSPTDHCGNFRRDCANFPKGSDNSPKGSGNFPKGSGNFLKGSGNFLKGSGNFPKGSGNCRKGCDKP
jgi:hypothetical protein